MSDFQEEVSQRLDDNARNASLTKAARQFLVESVAARYSYNFSWLGRPIIQYPQDIMAMQELVWNVQPDLIIEAGIAHGGSLVFYASLLELNAVCGGPEHARVVGVDVELRPHNRSAIEAHPLAKRIALVDGSSTDADVIERVALQAHDKQRVLVCLDSNHTDSHVRAELSAYAPMVTLDSYCVVFDTFVEALPDDMYPDRPWGRGNNPGTAVRAFLAEHPEFEADVSFDAKLLITVAPGGYLKRIA